MSSPQTNLRKKVAWLIVVRAVLSTVFLGSATLMQVTAPGWFAVDPYFSLIGLIYGLTLAYALMLRKVEANPSLVDLQLGGDAIVVSAFIYFTGGITSYFALLYVLPIVAGSVVQHRRGGLFVAMLSAILYIEVVAGQYLAGGGVLSRVWGTANRSRCRRCPWRSTSSPSTSSASSWWRCSADRWPKACARAACGWRRRRAKSPICRR
jgi:hypothetical protein